MSVISHVINFCLLETIDFSTAGLAQQKLAKHQELSKFATRASLQEGFKALNFGTVLTVL